jgi:hypothetical protein
MRHGRAWHAQTTLEVGKGAKPEASTAAQGGGSKNKRKKKMVGGSNQSLAGAPTATVVAAMMGGGRGPRGDKSPRQASDIGRLGGLSLSFKTVLKFKVCICISHI